MSFDIFLQRFHEGEAVDGDGPAMVAVLTPLLVETSEGGFGRVRTGDGGADVYGLDHPERGLLINHAEGSQIWDVIVEVARAGGVVVMPAGCAVCVLDPALATHLPEKAPPARVIASGQDLRRVVEAA